MHFAGSVRRISAGILTSGRSIRTMSWRSPRQPGGGPHVRGSPVRGYNGPIMNATVVRPAPSSPATSGTPGPRAQCPAEPDREGARPVRDRSGRGEEDDLRGRLFALQEDREIGARRRSDREEQRPADRAVRHRQDAHLRDAVTHAGRAVRHRRGDLARADALRQRGDRRDPAAADRQGRRRPRPAPSKASSSSTRSTS